MEFKLTIKKEHVKIVTMFLNLMGYKIYFKREEK